MVSYSGLGTTKEVTSNNPCPHLHYIHLLSASDLFTSVSVTMIDLTYMDYTIEYKNKESYWECILEPWPGVL